MNGRPAQSSGENGFRACKGQRGCNGRDFGQYGSTALCNRRIARFDSDSLEGRRKLSKKKAVEGIQPIMAETTPQKLNASLEKNLLRPLCRKLLQRLLSKYRLFPNGKQVNYEKFIGENLFGKIGILVFVIGVGFFVKYAIDKDWINETLRTVLGFLTGSHCWWLPNACKRSTAHSAPCLRVAPCRFSISRRHCFIFITFPQTVAFIILDSYTVHVYPVHSV